MKVLSSVFLIIFLSVPGLAQTTNSNDLQFYGNLRFAHLGSDTQGDGIGGDNTSLRTRLGLIYHFNENHSLRGRLATTISQEFEEVRFTIKADGRGLDYGSVSFDEFFYRYKDSSTEIRVGRFQETVEVMSNAKRSQFRFQSNVNFIHWSDGLYIKQNLNQEWFLESITEYQPRGHTTYPYRSPLNFENNPDNFTFYNAIENRTRDRFNIIQKGIGLFYVPDAYLKPGGFTDYTALTSRIVFDFPAGDALSGGSVRFAGEYGQNLNAEFADGSSFVASAGVNNVAGRHEFMVEFAATDSEWLTATVFAPDADEVEFRYRIFVNKAFNLDFRYRIRDFRTEGIPTAYSTFLRATYSF